MKKEVFVQQLKFGAYVSQLDRPWTETPFMFQGFVLNNQTQLDALKKYCKKVIIDLEKGSDVPALRPVLEGPPTGVLATIKTKVTYEEKASVDVELPVARAAYTKSEVVVKDILGTAQAGKALDAPRVREAVTSMTDSVVRNPDAMMLLNKLKETSAHTLDRAVGVSIYMITFGRFLQLPREQLDLLGMVGLLQDVGKVKLPAELLAKKEPLTDIERKVCQSHVTHSLSILKATPGLPRELTEIAELHHERFDGNGYPKRIFGPQIGLYGAIAGLVDCFDAMTHPRPYAEVYAPSNALSVLYNERNEKFDGPLVEQFIQCIGIFPVGALVELNSGEVGIVIAQNLARRLLPRVMVVLDKNRNPLRPQVVLDLAKEPMADPDTPYRIRRTLEKGSVPIDPSEFFI